MNKDSKYQWPADRLTDDEMSILHCWREQTGTPINHLLKQAVVELNKVIKNKEVKNGNNYARCKSKRD